MRILTILILLVFISGCACVCPPKDIIFPARVHGLIPGQVIVIPFQLKKGDVDKIIEMQEKEQDDGNTTNRGDIRVSR